MPRKTGLAPQGVRQAARFNEAAARCRGKRGGDVNRLPRLAAASMRPRPDAAENPHPLSTTTTAPAGLASMRPRPDAAENSYGSRRWDRDTERFNEAAARCRGKR